MILKRVGFPLVIVALTVFLTVLLYRVLPGVVSAAPTVGLSQVDSVDIPLTVEGIAPGDNATVRRLRVRYDGEEPAWVGLSSRFEGRLSEGSKPLSVSVLALNQRFAVQPETKAIGLFEPGSVIDLAVEYSLPLQAGNTYQSTRAQLFLRLDAVQAPGNTRYDTNGRAVGPVSWTASGNTGELVSKDPIQVEAPSLSPCVGDECNSSTKAQPTPVDNLPPAVEGEVAPIASSGTCCTCLQSVLWIGLIYAMVLVLAMLASFLLGWHLRNRQLRARRVLARHQKSDARPQE